MRIRRLLKIAMVAADLTESGNAFQTVQDPLRDRDPLRAGTVRSRGLCLRAEVTRRGVHAIDGGSLSW